MSEKENKSVDFTETPPKINETKRFIKVFLGRPVVIIGAIFILVFLVAALVPQLFTSVDPYKHDLKAVLQAPGTPGHWLGTDALGRDLYARIVYGARTAIIIATLAISIAVFAGTILGMLAGYFGGWTFTIIMRLIDALMAFPQMLLMLTIAALLGGGIKMVIIALGIGSIAGYTRVMCAQVMSIRENDYILAERSLGASNRRVMFKHLFPNAFPPMIVMITLAIGMTIMAEAGLSYLGIGVKEPTIAWGSLVNDGNNFLLSFPLLALAPGAAIAIVVFGANMVGDGLRDALDPRLRGTL